MNIISINKPSGIIDGSIMLKTLKFSYNHIVSFFGKPAVIIVNNLYFVEWHIEFEDGLRVSLINYFKKEISEEEEVSWMISADKKQGVVYERIKSILESKDWGIFNYIRNKIFDNSKEELKVDFCDCCECSPCDCDWGN